MPIIRAVDRGIAIALAGSAVAMSNSSTKLGGSRYQRRQFAQ